MERKRPLSSIEKNIRAWPSRPGRTVTVLGRLWKWKPGKGGMVTLYCSDGNVIVAHAAIVKGMPVDAFERGQYKRTSDGMITPAHICKFLRSL